MLRPLSAWLLLASVYANIDEEEAVDELSPNNNRQLLDVALIGAYIGVLTGGASIGASLTGYGLKLSISDKICSPLNFEGMSVTRHGSPTTPCRDIDVGVREVCVYEGVWNLGTEGMVQFE